MHRAISYPQGGLEQRLQIVSSAVYSFLANDNLNVVLFEAGETHTWCNGSHFVIDTCLGEAELTGAGQDVLVKSLAPAHHRRQKGNALPAKVGADAVKNLTAALHRQGLSTIDAVLHASFGVQQAQVMRNLGYRSDSRIAATTAHALFYRHRRRDAGQQINIGPGHNLDKLARIGGQTVNVTA